MVKFSHTRDFGSLQQTIQAVFVDHEIEASNELIRTIAKGIADKYVDENYAEIALTLKEQTGKLVTESVKESVAKLEEEEKAIAMCKSGNNGIAVLSNKGNMKAIHGAGRWEEIPRPW